MLRIHLVSWFLIAFGLAMSVVGQELEIAGLHIVPHLYSSNLRWRNPPDPSLGASSCAARAAGRGASDEW